MKSLMFNSTENEIGEPSSISGWGSFYSLCTYAHGNGVTLPFSVGQVGIIPCFWYDINRAIS